MFKIRCPSCKGKGRVDLAPHLIEVLAALRSGKRTAAGVKEWLGAGVTVNAISNRLNDLHKIGLVTRHREGKFFHYSIPTKKRK